MRSALHEVIVMMGMFWCIVIELCFMGELSPAAVLWVSRKHTKLSFGHLCVSGVTYRHDIRYSGGGLGEALPSPIIG